MIERSVKFKTFWGLTWTSFTLLTFDVIPTTHRDLFEYWWFQQYSDTCITRLITGEGERCCWFPRRVIIQIRYQPNTDKIHGQWRGRVETRHRCKSQTNTLIIERSVIFLQKKDTYVDVPTVFPGSVYCVNIQEWMLFGGSQVSVNPVCVTFPASL